jgi:hypothetical protein
MSWLAIRGMQGRDWWAHSVCCKCGTITSQLMRSGRLSFAVPVQTVNEGAYRIRDFRLRFYASETMWQPPQEVVTVIPICCLRTAGIIEWEERSGSSLHHAHTCQRRLQMSTSRVC